MDHVMDIALQNSAGNHEWKCNELAHDLYVYYEFDFLPSF